MGYKCDACGLEDAAVFCFVDQAVLCTKCDNRMHSANKIAQRHERVALKKGDEAAMCDICQENKALLFCSEDRALICRRCDLMIHSANEFVAKHSRYLMSGVTVGLNALDGGGNGSTDIDQVQKKPYSLRNNALAGKREPWKDTNSWNREASSPHLQSDSGLPDAAPSGSQPSLISMAPNQAPNSTNPVGSLTGASLITPFGATDEQALGEQETSPSGSPVAATAAGAGPRNLWGDWGSDALGLRPNSADFTLAAELLGMPSVSNGFSAKDIDAAYIFDGEGDLDASLSALLEVPDLELQYQNNPTVVNFRASDAVPEAHAAGKQSPSDGVVPDYKESEVGTGNFTSTKRQRLQS